MKAMTLELTLTRWPYGLEVQPSGKGLLLRPQRKARATWNKSFRQPRKTGDELRHVRELENRFDAEEWVW
jgi:hypothetical protein